ncbi:MAG: PAS domain S-box protein [Candidatus Uhrbacteria bacterium]
MDKQAEELFKKHEPMIAPLIIFALIIFVVQSFLMLVMPAPMYLFHFIIAPALLTILILPLGYFLFVKPMHLYYKKNRTNEEIIKDKEESFKTLFESAPIGLTRVSLEGGFIDVNVALCKILGYTRDELITKTFQEVTYPDEYLQDDIAGLKKISAGELEFYGREKKYIKKNGDVIDVRVKVSAIKDIQGRVKFVVTMIEDISDQKKAEEMYKLITETIQDVFFVSDPAMSKIIYVSPAYEKIWGESCSNLYQSPYSFLRHAHPEDVDVLIRELKVLHQKSEPYSIEYRIVRPDGIVRWIQERGFPVKDSAGKPKYLVGSAMDITDRKELEKTTKLLEMTKESDKRLQEVSQKLVMEDEKNKKTKVQAI